MATSKDWDEMATRNDWKDIMKDVPEERKNLYLQIRDKLGVMFGYPITETKKALDLIVEASFEPGTRTAAGIKYDWRLARMPYYVEWKLSKPNGEILGVVFQMVIHFLKQGWELSRAGVENHNRKRIRGAIEELERFIFESRQQLQDTNLFSLSTLKALGKQKQEKQKQSHEDEIVSFLASKGYTKHNIEDVTIPLSQLLAEMYNLGRTESKYLALIWDDYENDEDVKKVQKSDKKEAAKTTLDKGDLSEDYGSNISTVERISPPVSADTQDPQPVSVIKRSDSRSSLSTFSPTSDQSFLLSSSHNNNILSEPQQYDSLTTLDSTTSETSALDQSSPSQPRPAIGMARHANRRLRRNRKKAANQTDQTEEDNHSDQIEQETSAQSAPPLPTETNTRSTVSSLSLLPGPLRDVIGSAAKDNIGPKARSKSSGSSSLRVPVAVPDFKYLFKSKKTETGVSDTSSVTQKEVGVASKDTRAQLNPKSVLRAEAPEFVPMSLASSSATSPEFAASSVPMSVSTSTTSQASAEVQAIIAREGLNVTFDLRGPSYTIKDAPMIYPSERSIKELKTKSLDRPRSNSTSELPSITLSNFDEVEFAEQAVEEEQMLEVWPDFADDHLQVATPWRYANYDETPESIIMNYGHHDNNYRVSPYYTRIREVASRNNMLSMEVPAILMKTRSGYCIATGQFDFDNNVWRVFAPSISPGADLRDLDDHPDYLEPAKLLEVQGLEQFFYDTHIAVRLIHTCQREACKNQLRDDHAGTIVCRGCGPLTPVRYCSLRCQFDDLPSHWKECGNSKFYPPTNLCVDPDISFPASFKNLFPLIKDISGFDTMERQRIHRTSKCFDGEYGLYPEDSMRVIHIKMPSSNDDELIRRVQRLINCALLDRRNKVLISYLYVLIRDALCKQIKTRYGEYPVVLRFQFINEWDFDYKGPEGYELLDETEPCECMWVGTANFSSCKDTCKAGQFIGEKYRETGLKLFVESLEKEHWLLRAWYTRHPNVTDWRERVLGKGFNGVKPKKFKNVLPVLGVGYDGHISVDKVVGEWRPRLTLEAPPPPARRVRGGAWEQDPNTFIWKEPEA